MPSVAQISRSNAPPFPPGRDGCHLAFATRAVSRDCSWRAAVPLQDDSLNAALLAVLLRFAIWAPTSCDRYSRYLSRPLGCGIVELLSGQRLSETQRSKGPAVASIQRLPRERPHGEVSCCFTCVPRPERLRVSFPFNKRKTVRARENIFS